MLEGEFDIQRHIRSRILSVAIQLNFFKCTILKDIAGRNSSRSVGKLLDCSYSNPDSALSIDRNIKDSLRN